MHKIKNPDIITFLLLLLIFGFSFFSLSINKALCNHYSRETCNELAKNIDKKIDNEANYCNVDSDCTVSADSTYITTSINCFSCFYIINKNVDLSEIKSDISVLRQHCGCFTDLANCISPPDTESLKCIEGKCRDIGTEDSIISCNVDEDCPFITCPNGEKIKRYTCENGKCKKISYNISPCIKPSSSSSSGFLSCSQDSDCPKSICPDGFEYQSFACINNTCNQLLFFADPCLNHYSSSSGSSTEIVLNENFTGVWRNRGPNILLLKLCVNKGRLQGTIRQRGILNNSVIISQSVISENQVAVIVRDKLERDTVLTLNLSNEKLLEVTSSNGQKLEARKISSFSKKCSLGCPNCDLVRCANPGEPQEGCEITKPIINGCRSCCSQITCSSSSSSSGGDGLITSSSSGEICPIVDCAAPPEGCNYIQDTTSSGCPTCSSLVCQSSSGGIPEITSSSSSGEVIALKNNSRCIEENPFGYLLLMPGDPFNTSVTFLNTGDKPWRTDTHNLAYNYNIDPQDVLKEISLPVEVVSPGESVTFELMATAPVTTDPVKQFKNFAILFRMQDKDNGTEFGKLCYKFISIPKFETKCDAKCKRGVISQNSSLAPFCKDPNYVRTCKVQTEDGEPLCCPANLKDPLPADCREDLGICIGCGALAVCQGKKDPCDYPSDFCPAREFLSCPEGTFCNYTPDQYCYVNNSSCITPICLSPDTRIKTDTIEKRVADIKVDDIVLTDSKKPVKVIKIGKTEVKKHKILKVTLNDATILEVSPGHPTSDGRLFKDLKIGDKLDDRIVVETKLIPYKYKYTYDILPGSKTGNYYANGVLVGSTLQ